MARKYSLETLSPDALSSGIVSMLTTNALNGLGNWDKRVKETDLEFLLLRIRRDERSEDIYMQEYANINPSGNIFIFLERKTGGMYTNSNCVGFDLVLERGISEADLLSKSMRLTSYLFSLDAYYNPDNRANAPTVC